MKTRNRNHVFVVGIFVVAILSACRNSTAPTVFPLTSNPTLELSPITSKITKTVFPPTIQSTATFPPIAVTNTLTPMPVASLIPLPTEVVQAWLSEMIDSNGGCRLPCWWGIVPGETTWEEAIEIFGPYASKISGHQQEDYQSFAVYFYWPPDTITTSFLGLAIEVNNHIVEDISVMGVDAVPSLQLPALMAEYGEPGGVWVDAYSGSALDYGPRHSAIHVFYPELGIFAQYDAPESEVQDGILSTCLEYGPLLWFSPPGLKTSYEDFVKGIVMDYQFPFLPVSEALGMDVHTFYNLYKSPNQEVCMKTPVDLWVWGVTPTP